MKTFSKTLFVLILYLPDIFAVRLAPVRFQRQDGVNEGLSVRQRLKNTLEYISVGSAILPVALYSFVLVIVPPSVVLTIHLLKKVDQIREDQEAMEAAFAAARSFQTRFGSENDIGCFNRVSCEFINAGRSFLFQNRTADRLLLSLGKPASSGKSTKGCSHHYCSWFQSSTKPLKRKSRETRQDDEAELNVVQVFPSWLESLFQWPELPFGLTKFVQNVGLWPHFIAAVTLLSIPVTLFCVAMFLVRLVLFGDDEASDQRRTTSLKKRSRIGRSPDFVETKNSECFMGIFCAVNKEY